MPSSSNRRKHEQEKRQRQEVLRFLMLLAYLVALGLLAAAIYGIGIYFIVKVVKFAWGG